MPRRQPCQCHMGPLYAGLETCPKCGHKSFDPKASACERSKCGFEMEQLELVPRRESPVCAICGEDIRPGVLHAHLP